MLLYLYFRFLYIGIEIRRSQFSEPILTLSLKTTVDRTEHIFSTFTLKSFLLCDTLCIQAIHKDMEQQPVERKIMGVNVRISIATVPYIDYIICVLVFCFCFLIVGNLTLVTL